MGSLNNALRAHVSKTLLLIRKRISCALGCVCTILLFLELTVVGDKGLWKSIVEDEVKIK